MLLKIPENRLVSFLHAKVHKKLQHSNALLVLGHVEKNHELLLLPIPNTHRFHKSIESEEGLLPNPPTRQLPHPKIKHSTNLQLIKCVSSNPHSKNINFRIVVESFMRIVMVLLNEDISADDHKKLCEVTKTDVGEDTWGAIVNFF